MNGDTTSLVFINSADITSPKTLHLGDYLCRGMLIKYVGVAAEGETPLMSDFGTIDLNCPGPIAHIDLEELDKVNALTYGVAFNSLNKGAASYAAFYIPFYNPLDEIDHNCFKISKDHYIQIPAIHDTHWASCNVYVYLNIVQIGTQKYTPLIFSRVEQLTSDSKIYIDDRNINLIAITEPSHEPGKVILKRDGSVLNDAEWAACEILTNMLAEIESSTENMILLKPYKDQLEAVGHSYELEIVGGTDNDDMKYMIFSMLFEPQKSASTTYGIQPEVAKRFSLAGVLGAVYNILPPEGSFGSALPLNPIASASAAQKKASQVIKKSGKPFFTSAKG